MTIAELLAVLAEKDIKLAMDRDELVVRGKKQALDSSVLTALRENKQALRELIRTRESAGSQSAAPTLSEELPAAELSPQEIGTIVSRVPGGADNAQDIYPLAPLQEGILFHHLMDSDKDPYLHRVLLSFASRARLDAYQEAMQKVIDRHDILRTAIAWEGLRDPVQVVWRRAVLPLEEVTLDPPGQDAAERLYTRFDQGNGEIDIRQAPLLRLHICEDKVNHRWLAMLLWHHLIGDHTTLEIMQEEIEAHLLGKSDCLAAPVSFRNLVIQARTGASKEEHERFFRRMLGDVDEPTALFGLVETQADRAGIESARITAGGILVRRLRESARAAGVSMASLCHAAWAQVLAKVSGRNDVVFGTVLMGRMQEGAARAMGLFINTLPFRVHVGQESVERTVRQVNALLGELLLHEQAPLVLAQRCSGVAAPTPLFSALLNYRQSSQESRADLGAGAWDGIQVLSHEGGTNYPLVLSVQDFGEDLMLMVHTQAWIGPNRVCELMRKAMESLALAMETSPNVAMCTLDILAEQERKQLLQEWNSTKVDYGDKRCMHELFEEQAELRSEAVAVVSADQKLSYGELNRRANQLGYYLQKRGIGPEVRVGICLERSLEMVIGLLAIMKAGGAYVPLDPSYPAERLRYMAEDAQVAVVITQGRFQERLAAGMKVLCLDEVWERVAAEKDENLQSPLVEENLIYVMYTSGSTGRPKGVMNRHGGLRNRLQWMKNAYHLNEGDSVLQKTPFGFDVSVWEFFWPLMKGARLVMAKPEGHRDGIYLAGLIEEEQITAIHFVPAMLHAFLQSEKVVEKCGSLERIFCSGEALGIDLTRECVRTIKAELHNLYGPTEAAIEVTYWKCEEETGRKTVPIGRPIANTQMYVLDGEMSPTGIGAPGELYIGGAGLARGYWKQAGLTAEKFVPDSFGRKGGERLYRTGDRVRWREDGVLEYLGRVDLQVKIRGYRIELGEVEAVLEQHGGVKQAVVVVREEEGGVGKRLVGYVVLRDGVEGGMEELRSYLRERLPEYMVPQVVVKMREFPLLASGKLDRKSLPAVGEQEGKLRGYVGPRTGVEEILVGIWEQVLRREKIGIEDNFFDLGGHSLLAMQVMSRAQNVLNLALPLRVLFETPTIAGLAAEIESRQGAGERLEEPPLVAVEKRENYELSFAQQRLWFLEQLEPGRAIYNVPFGIRLKGKLDIEALERSLGEIVRRHEVLRTRLGTVEGRGVQVVDEWRGMEVARHDLRVLPPVEREGEAGRMAKEEAETGFDLERGPMIRARLLQMGEQDHVLLVTMHHVVSDGWSVGIMVREFCEFYEGYRKEEEAKLEELKIQYKDFAVWQRGWLQGEVLGRQLEYWRKQLGGMEVLELPTDYARPAMASHRGGLVRFEWGKELVERMKELSRQEGVTLFMTLLAGFQVLLHRYSGQRDIVVGTDVSNRNRAETEGLIGFFVNELVLRTEVGGELSFRELLKRVRRVTLEAYGHQDLPFERVVEDMQPERDLGRSPLFQVKLVMQNVPETTLALPGLKVEGFGQAIPDSKLDLTLVVREIDEGILGFAEYALDLYKGPTIERMMGHLRAVMEEMVGHAGERIAQFDYLSQGERRQVIEEWNRTEAAFPLEKCVHELFEEQVERTPEAVAVMYEGERLSYGELNVRANQLGRYLRKLGVGPEVRVGICMERGLEMMIGILGILKAGGAYVPMDPEYPGERLEYMVEDGQVSVMVTEKKLRERLPGGWVQVVCVDEEWEEIEGEGGEGREGREEKVESGVMPENLGYVIYTSGSTGKPKGVGCTHRGMSNLAGVQRKAFAVKKGERVLQFASMSFDAATWEWMMALLGGGELILSRREKLMRGEGLKEVLEEERVSVATLPPSVLGLVEEGGLERLRTLVVAGEACPGGVVKKWAVGREMINAYGPTETTVCAAMTGRLEEDEGGARIGRGIENTKLYVLDEEQRAVGIGMRGELYVGGEGLARGYVGQGGRTAEKFVPNPYGVRGGERLYRTGDWVRWGEKGELEFLGRVDDQVKVRGYRIELGEVEAVLQEHVGVKQAAVLVRGEGGEKRLVGYVVLGERGGVRGQELRRYLQERLPEYMVPNALVELVEMPLTVNGKIDRKTLSQLAEQEPERQKDHIGPRNVTEEILQGFWEEVLSHPKIGIFQNFFELGGHSLKAMQVMSRIQNVLNLELPFRILFETPTIAGLAAEIEKRQGGDVQSQEPPLVSVEGLAGYPLSFAQQRLWFLHQLDPDSAAYNAYIGVRLIGELDVDAVDQCLNEIMRRHQVLRTSFQTKDGEAVQVVGGALPARLELIDLINLDTRKAEHELEHLALAQGAKGFDLTKGPLLRTILVRMKEREHVLLAAMHHIVSDGWSAGILMREFKHLYEAYRKGKDSPLPQPAIQYKDYALWQRHWMQGEILDMHLEYWRKHLAGMEMLELPLDHVRPAVASHRGSNAAVDLDEELSEKLRALGRREGVTLFMTLLGAYQVLLSVYSGQEDIVVGTPVANRRRVETEGLIGFFVNHLVLRNRVTKQWSFTQLLHEVREVTLAAFAHQDLPFERLVEELAPERTLSHAPLFQVIFALQNMPQEELYLTGLELCPFGVSQEFEKSDLSLVFHDSTPVQGTLKYATDLFEESTAVRMIEHFKNIVTSMCADPEQRIGEVSVLSRAERRQLLAWRPQTSTNQDRKKCIHTLFEERVTEIPEAIAVMYEKQKLTYAEVNQRANQLGWFLRSLGVGPELRVGICMERSLETVVALLGVLKAGAAYVPLDADLPADRLAIMMEDAQMVLLLTHSRLMERLPSTTMQVICIDENWPIIYSQPTGNIDAGASAENLAYVIYTSGSTGRPKGVGIEHRQITSYVTAIIDRITLKKSWTYGLLSSFAADLGNTMLFPSLCVGGTLHVISEDRGEDGQLLVKYLSEFDGLDCLKITPTHLHALMTLGGAGVLPRKRLLLGGEATRWEWLHNWQKKQPECRMWNHYGPTECTVGVCVYEASMHMEDNEAKMNGNLPLGNALDCSQLYVLDDQGELAALGIPGELCIGGESVGRGYLNAVAATAEHFVPDLYSGKHGTRLYRTGDRARWRRPGELEFLGRLDEQVKLRGYRIESAEIEAVMSQHPGVKQCAVVLRGDGDQKRLVMYIVPEVAAPPSGTGSPSLVLSRIIHQNKVESEYLYREIFQDQIYFQHGIELKEDACIFDVGANIGMFTMFAAERCGKGKIYAFEPVPDIFECLKANAMLCDGVPVKTFQIGLSSEEKDAEFTYYSRYSMMSGLSSYANAGEEAEVIRQILKNQYENGDDNAGELLRHLDGLLEGRLAAQTKPGRLRRLSDIIREENVEQIDVLKIDVQRAEMDVLSGIDAEDWGRIQQVVMEVHDGANSKTEGRVGKIVRMLEENGFYAAAEQYKELQGTDRWNLYASRKPENKRTLGLAPVRLQIGAGMVEGPEMKARAFRKYLATKLPEYMVPSAYVIVDQLPRTANGKLDRKALPEPGDNYQKSNYVAPRTSVESILTGIWCEVLDLERAGIHDNFFELGGHSLLAAQVIARIIAAFGIELPLRVIFEAPTIAELATHIEKGELAMESMLSELEALSNEEAKVMLSWEINDKRQSPPSVF